MNNTLKHKYKGSIAFGSSLKEEKYKDIDLFLLLDDFNNKKELTQKLQQIDPRISILYGNREELEKGIASEDMLYDNIIKGLPFSCEDFVIELRFKKYILKKRDIQERFILASREVYSCLEFKDKKYTALHLPKGLMDLIYTITNYYDYSPQNDAEAIQLFKELFHLQIPKNLKDTISLIDKYKSIIL